MKGHKMPGELSEILSEDLRGNESLSKFENADALAKSYLELEGKQGGIKQEFEKKMEGMVAIPGEDATDEDKATFYSQLGRPEKPEDYPDVDFEGLPDEVKENSELLSELSKMNKEFCHSIGLNTEQYKKATELSTKQFLTMVENFAASDEKAEKESVEILTKEFGGEESMKEALELGRRAIAHYDGEDSEIKSFLEETRLGSYAPVAKLICKMAQDLIKEDVIVGKKETSKGEKEIEISPITGEPMLKYDKSPELMSK